MGWDGWDERRWDERDSGMRIVRGLTMRLN